MSYTPVTMSVGDKIQQVVNCMDRKEYAHALNEVCQALDVTSKRHYQLTKSSGEKFKKFIEQYRTLIIFLAMAPASVFLKAEKEMLFGNPDFGNPDFPDISNKETIKLSEIIYHCLRCSLVHSTGNKNIVFSDDSEIGGRPFRLPIDFVWALAAIVILSPENKNERISDDQAWIRLIDEDYNSHMQSRNYEKMWRRYNINALWGKMDMLKNIFAKNKLPLD